MGELLNHAWNNMYANYSLVPLGVSIAVFQASLYDVPGGYRAVMFDRFSGVNNKVGSLDSRY